MYYGEKVAIYFKWMEHYTNWLILPGVIGMLLTIFDPFPPDDSPLSGLFSLLICIWSPLFIKYWRRKQAELKVKWDVFADKFKYEQNRPQFYGEVSIDPVTEKEKLIYPKYKRILNYCYSALVSAPFFVVALCLNVVFLNLNGYVDPEGSGSWIYVKLFA